MKPKIFKFIGIAILIIAYSFLALLYLFEFLLFMLVGYIALLFYVKGKKINKSKKIGISLNLLSLLFAIGIAVGLTSVIISPLTDNFRAIIARLLILGAAFLAVILAIIGLIIYRMGQKKSKG